MRRLLLLAVLLTAPALARAQNVPAPDAAFVLPAGATHVDVPFRQVGTLVLVPARIAGGPARWYILDTGAGIHVLDRPVADSLGLFGGASINATGAGGTVAATVLADLSVQVGDVTATGQRVMVLPLGALSAQVGHPVAGILGFDLLRLFATTFDYPRSTVRFEAPGAFTPPDSALVLPMEVVEGRPFVAGWLGRADANPATGRFLIDTGYDGAVSLNTPFVDAHGILNAPGGRQEGRVGGVGGTATAVVGRLEGFGIGPLRFAAPVATLSRATSGASASAASAGLLGGELFARTRMTTDYAGNRFVIACTEACAAPFEADMSGLALLAEADGFRVVSARAGTPAAAAGLAAGDLVTHVDGRPAAEVGLMATRRLFRQDGATRVLTVRRGPETRTVTMPLRRLL